MNYWILKTNPRYNDPFVDWIRAGSVRKWHSRRIPKNFAKGDKLVIWQSGTGFRVIALGEVKTAFSPKDEQGSSLFRVLHTTDILENQPDIVALRKLPLFEGAGFLKSAAAGTIFRLSIKQGEYLYSVAQAKTEPTTENKAASAVQDLAPSGNECPDRADSVVFRYNRDLRIRDFVLKRAAGVCEYCGAKGFSTPNGGHYLEAHHVISLSRKGPDTVRNVIALCPNHHREAHFGLHAEVIEKEMIHILETLNANQPNSEGYAAP